MAGQLRQGGIIFGLVVLQVSGLCPHVSRADEPPAHVESVFNEQPALPGQRPLEVSLALTIIDFARINIREESFDLHGYLEVTWQDDRLKQAQPASKSVAANPWHRLRPSPLIWTPKLTFANALDEVKIQNPNLFADDMGNMVQSFEFVGKFAKPLHFRRFPFDTQELQVFVQAAGEDRPAVTLVADDGNCGVLEGAFLPDWDLGETTAWTQESTDRVDRTAFQTFIIETRIHRRSTFYIYRVLLPLTLLVVASWCVLWFDVTQLQPQISTSLSIMLANVVFSFGVDFGLPRLPYLTMVDRQVLLSFSFAFLMIVSVAFLHLILRRQGQQSSEHYQRRFRVVFPLAYVIAVALTHATP
jgi:Neurotransmitter-gated ion-channel ligand binding domain